MTNNSTMTEVDVDQVAVAISALTAAARRRRIIGAGTPQEHTEPVDAGEILCHVVTAVAANLGGVDQLLAGRPGSWEANYIRQIVESTAGSAETELLRWRTEPIRLELDVEDVLLDMGIYDLYDTGAAEAGDAHEAARSAVFEAAADPAELARAHELEAALSGVLGTIRDADEMARDAARWQECNVLYDTVWQRAEAVGGPLLDAAAAAQRLVDRIDELWEADKLAYRDAYAAAARQLLVDRGLDTLAVELVDPQPSDLWLWDELTEDLHDHARKTAALPMTGAAPDWTDGTPADALRRAGRTYTERANAGRDILPGDEA